MHPKLLELRTASSTIRLHLVGGKLLVVFVVYVCMFCGRYTWQASLNTSRKRRAIFRQLQESLRHFSAGDL